MRENYPPCVAFTRKEEGGNTQLAGDTGGRTGRGGITHAVYDDYRRSKGLPLQDVWLITDSEIADIYRTKYWDKVSGDNLAVGVDLVVFDYAINSGPAKAYSEYRAVRTVMNAPAAMVTRISNDRLSFVHSLSSWRRFGRNWGGRVARCEALGLQMAGADLGHMTGAAAGAQSSARAAKSAVTRGTVAAPAAAAGAHHYLEYGAWIIGIILALGALAIIVNAFNAWRQGQRADTLTQAVAAMRAAAAAAEKAKAAATAQADAKEKAIAADQEKLTAARAAIGGAIAAQPAQPAQPTSTPKAKS